MFENDTVEQAKFCECDYFANTRTGIALANLGHAIN